MNCKKCGTPLTPTDTFCRNCGEPVNAQQTLTPEVNVQPEVQNLNSMPTEQSVLAGSNNIPTTNSVIQNNTNPVVESPLSQVTPTTTVNTGVENVNPIVGVNPVAPEVNTNLNNYTGNVASTPMQQPVSIPNTMGNQMNMQQNNMNQKQSKNKNVIFIIIIVVLVVVIAVLGYFIVTKKLNPETPNTPSTPDTPETPNTPENPDTPENPQISDNNAYKYGNFEFIIPKNYYTLEDPDNETMLIANDEYKVGITAYIYSYVTIDNYKTELDTIKGSLTNMGLKINNTIEKSASNVDWILFDGTYDSAKLPVIESFASLGNYYVIELFVQNFGIKNNSDLMDILVDDLSPMLNTAKYVGSSNFSPNDEKQKPKVGFKPDDMNKIKFN